VPVRRGGNTYLVTNAAQAARILLGYDIPWPHPDTELSRTARAACLSALEGGDPELAREAFRLAVEEASQNS
jgi:hypothetical protein